MYKLVHMTGRQRAARADILARLMVLSTSPGPSHLFLGKVLTFVCLQDGLDVLQ